jgi:hypothetical protein
VFALAWDEAAPELWLLIARAGGLLAFVMAYRLGSRLAGPAAGVIAAGALLLADEFVRNAARGNSEGLLVALCLWAVERHLDGRRMDAFLLGFAAALLRPEVWPFWGLYGLWIVYGAWRERGRLPWREIVIVGGVGAATLLLWFVPEWIGSGNPIRAAERARQPNPDSAAFADIPFVEVFIRSAAVLMVPVYVGGVIAVVVALKNWRRGRFHLLLAGIATLLMIGVALMTQGGFAGNLRYVALPGAVVCVLAGAGWVAVVRGTRRRYGTRWAAALAVAIAALSLPFVLADLGALRRDARLVRSEASFYGDSLRVAIERAGGPARIRECGAVITGPFQVQAVAWYLGMHGRDVQIFAFPPGTALAPRFSALSYDPRFSTVAETKKWVVKTSCLP